MNKRQRAQEKAEYQAHQALNIENRQPSKRRSLKRGSEVLLCRQGSDPVQADGTYFPRWHLAKLSKRRRGEPGSRLALALKAQFPAGDVPDPLLWHYRNHVTRVWAYVPRCGAGQGFPSTKVAYGKTPTCKRCLKEGS